MSDGYRSTEWDAVTRHACRTNPMQECLALAHLSVSPVGVYFQPRTEAYTANVAKTVTTVNIKGAGA